MFVVYGGLAITCPRQTPFHQNLKCSQTNVQNLMFGNIINMHKGKFCYKLHAESQQWEKVLKVSAKKLLSY